ncbi:Beta-barrel assembly-enhancing protease [Calidithermus terrae]|uniref:Beta-barrel assembly-enhancing protease n=1 Tax=Calidithermus terrae TaxID=1408545 RepID=A0A399ECR1_9DEIN|nr:tetratricopeptide repeat protein [Calidithermus terrae]RIH81303.1 Beta-barrel assembly-enhancing protease [Calidithermus terrae]
MRVLLPVLMLVGSFAVPVAAQAQNPAPGQGNSQFQELLNLCVQLFRLGRYQDALAVCERSVRSNPTNPDGLYWLARTQLRLGLTTAAVENLRKAIAQNAAYVQAYVALAQAYYDQYRLSDNREASRGVLDQALTVLRDAERINPKYAPIFATRGVVYSALGTYDRAVEAFNRSLALERDPQVIGLLANVYLKQSKLDDALKLLDEGVKAFPKDFTLRLNYGVALLIKNEPAAAIEQLKQATVINPAEAEGYVRLGQAYQVAKDWKNAGANFQNAVVKSPFKYPEAYAGLGRSYLELGDAAKARENFTKAVAMDSRNAEYYYWLGRANEALGNKAGAKDAYTRALQLRPGYKDAEEALARVQ